MNNEHMKEMRETQLVLMFDSVLTWCNKVLSDPKNLAKGSLAQKNPDYLKLITQAYREGFEARQAYMQKESVERIANEQADTVIESIRSMFHYLAKEKLIPEETIKRIIGGH